MPIAPEMVAAAADGSGRALMLAPAGTKVGALWERLTGWMGPGIPPPVVEPPVPSRIWDYPPGINTRIAIDRGAGRPRFAQLRGMARACWQIRLAIETAKVHVRQLDHHFTFDDPDQAKAYERGRKAGKATDPRIAELTEFFKRPDGFKTWRQWIAELVEDALGIAAVAHSLRRTRLGERTGRGGMVAAEQLDGATIQRRFDERGRVPDPPLEAYTQVIRGNPIARFTREQLLYWAPNQTTDLAYGTTATEWIELMANTMIRRELWRLQNYTGGSIPDALITTPEGWSADKIAEFQMWWESIHTDVQEAQHGARFIPGGPHMQVFWAKEKLLSDDVDEWFMRVVGYCMGQSPSWWAKAMNRATAEELANTAMQEGRLPLMADVSDYLTFMVRVGWGYTDIKHEFLDPRSLDRETKAKVIQQAGCYSNNEAREELDLDPLPVDFLMIGGEAVPVDALEDYFAAKEAALEEPGPDEPGSGTPGTTDGEQEAGRQAGGDGSAGAAETRAAAPRLRRPRRRWPVQRSRASLPSSASASPSRAGPAPRSGGSAASPPTWESY